MSDGRLTLLVLLPPIVWAVNLQVSYALSAFACEGAWPVLIHVSAIVSLAISLLAGGVAWRARRHDDGTVAGNTRRRRFMMQVAAAFGVLFALAILAQWIPAFLLDPCKY